MPARRMAMDDEKYLYDQVLLGRKKTCGKELFETTVNGRKEYNPIDEERAIKIVKYAMEYYLGWSPMQVWENLDDEVIKKMKLSGLVNQRIKFPVELVDQKENIKYLVCRMYPEKFHYNSDQAVEAYYDRVLSGKLPDLKRAFLPKMMKAARIAQRSASGGHWNLTADFQARRQCMIFSVPQKEDHLSVRINWRAHAGIYSSSLYVSCIILFIQSFQRRRRTIFSVYTTKNSSKR